MSTNTFELPSQTKLLVKFKVCQPLLKKLVFCRYTSVKPLLSKVLLLSEVKLLFFMRMRNLRSIEPVLKILKRKPVIAPALKPVISEAVQRYCVLDWGMADPKGALLWFDGLTEGIVTVFIEVLASITRCD